MDAISTPTRAGSPKRALLVDDDKMMLAVVGDMLRDVGMGEVVTGASGTSGLLAFDRMVAKPDVVICDLNMPGGDGFQFMEQLGARSYQGGVVVLSGLDRRTLNSAALMAQFHKLQILKVLSKPIDESALRDALATVL